MNTFTIVGCGDSAKGWVKRGIAIGSNDCEKFGQGVDHLILANHPAKFKQRLHTIKKSKAEIWCSSARVWKQIFPACRQIDRVTAFNQRIVGGFIYTSRTTPIMCLSMAVKMGAKEVIMWGVDMINHHAFRRGVKAGDQEIVVYKKFITAMRTQGINVYLGSHGTALDNFIPLWEPNIVP